MYGLLTTSPFRIPTDTGPLTIYYSTRIPIVDALGAPVLDGLGMPTFQAQPTINQVEQATIDVCFKHANNIGSCI